MNNNLTKYLLVFAAGMAVGVAVTRNNKDLRGLCVKTLGGLLDLKDKAMTQAEILKESAEDLLAESDAARKKISPAQEEA